jgi:predicted regulator of Ras-like GTPase activity (Roadblock/LC7/MglB family)
MFASHARRLEEHLLALATRVAEIRGLMLVDRNGLTLVSTLGSRSLEEALAAFTGSVLTQMDRAKEYFQMGPLYVMHLAGRDRQVLVTPLATDFALVAVVDAGANAPTVTLHMLAVTREILELVHSSSESEEGNA